MDTGFAKSIVKGWFDENQATLAEFVNSIEIDAPAGRAASLLLQMPRFTVGISAWDHGNKLEIITIDNSTDEASVEDRAYADGDKLRARLDALLKQLSRMQD